MITKTAVPNAANVLPKSLLSKLQRHCSGLIYIPAPRTKAQMNISQVRSLHNGSRRPSEIAEAVGVCAQHVRDIIRELEDGGISSSREYKVYEVVPQEIVEAVQKHVSGPVYVPGRVSEAERRRSIVQRLLRKGVRVSEVAKRSGLSERRVRQIRKVETELAQSELAAGKASVKSNRKKPQDRFKVGPVDEPGYVPPKRCSVCGIPVGPDEDPCEVCRYKAETKGNADSDIITIHNVPFAVIDRRF